MLTDILAALELDPGALMICLLAVFAGAYLKGFTGFGASMLWGTSLSLVLPPLQVVPMVLMFEVATSLFLLPRIWTCAGLAVVVVIAAILAMIGAEGSTSGWSDWRAGSAAGPIAGRISRRSAA